MGDQSVAARGMLARAGVRTADGGWRMDADGGWRMDGLVVDHGEDDALDREEVVQAMVLKKN